MTKIRKTGKVSIINDEYVIKKSNNKEIYEYLKSRNFNYFPKTQIEDEREIQEYLKDTNYPIEQRYYDLINLVSLLHNKTTYYKEEDEDNLKKVIDDVMNNIAYLYSYYTEIINEIENKIIMSPSEYLLARNINKIYYSLEYASNLLKNIDTKQKIRNTVIHNNLSLEHYIRNENQYLISWDKAKYDMPIFDLYKLFKKYPQYNYMTILEKYETNYPLLKYEKNILLALLSIPDIIDFEVSEIELTKNIKLMLEKLEILPNYMKQYPQNEQPKEET